jgi:hypothetical protein
MDGEDLRDRTHGGLAHGGRAVQRRHGGRGLLDLMLRGAPARGSLVEDLLLVGQAQVHHGLLQRVRHRVLRVLVWWKANLAPVSGR